MSDYIKREDVIRKITSSFDEVLGVGDAVDLLSTIPAADVVERKIGKWILDDDGLPICSECKEVALQRMFFQQKTRVWAWRMKRSKYCPHCGGKIERRGSELYCFSCHFWWEVDE